jgi:hypothetical protein
MTDKRKRVLVYQPLSLGVSKKHPRVLQPLVNGGCPKIGRNHRLPKSFGLARRQINKGAIGPEETNQPLDDLAPGNQGCRLIVAFPSGQPVL